MNSNRPTNNDIADLLDQIAGLLEIQEANPFRIRAYRNGARSVRAAKESVAQMASEYDSNRDERPF